MIIKYIVQLSQHLMMMKIVQKAEKGMKKGAGDLPIEIRKDSKM